MIGPQFPIITIALFSGYWIAIKGIEFQFSNYQFYQSLNSEKKKTVQMYILTIIITSMVLGIQWCFREGIWSGSDTPQTVQLVELGGLMLIILYLFELIFREMGLPLIIHHISTIAGTSCLCLLLQDWPNLAGKLVWILGFHATTEQPVFFALIFYQMKHSSNLTVPLLKFAAIQTLLFKLVIGLFAGQAVILAPAAPPFFAPISIIALVVLGVTQIHGARVMWKLSFTYENKCATTTHHLKITDEKQSLLENLR